MGQSSISCLNKVGHSMFWSSMWDNKASYARNLKEDFFFEVFFTLVFNDSVSANIIRYNKKSNLIKKKIKIITNEKIHSLYRYLANKSRLKTVHSKAWILKFQKWIIIYKFLYINNINKPKKINHYSYGDNFFFSYKFYKKSINYNKINYHKLKKINKLLPF